MADENQQRGNEAQTLSVHSDDQVITFAENVEINNLRLLQLPNKSFLRDLESSREFILKGDESSAVGPTVLCTSDKTYIMRKAETSNTMLLLDTKVDDGKIVNPNPQIRSIASHFYELSEHKPSLLKLRKIFKAATLSVEDLEQTGSDGAEMSEGFEADNEDYHAQESVVSLSDHAKEAGGRKRKRTCKPQSGFSLDEILGMMLASEREVIAALRQIQAFEYKGRWHCLDEVSFQETFDMVLTVITAKCLTLDHVPEETVCSDLIDTPEVAVVETLRAHSKTFKADLTEQGRFWCLDPVKVTKFRLRQVLKSKTFLGKEELFAQWSAALPRGSAEPDTAHLKGLAVSKIKNGEEKYYFFDANVLPDNPAQCFKQLFAFKERWIPEDIEPYILHLEGPDCTRANLLRKFTRLCKDLGTGKMILCAR